MSVCSERLSVYVSSYLISVHIKRVVHMREMPEHIDDTGAA
jgi:hypothetical protein